MFLWRNIKGCFTSLFLEMTKGTKKGQISYPKSNLKIAEKSSKIAQLQWSLTLRFILLHDPQNVALVLQIRLFLLVWVSKNIWKNKSSTKNCKVKNIELFSFIFTENLKNTENVKLPKTKNIWSLYWILLVLIREKKCSFYCQSIRKFVGVTGVNHNLVIRLFK